MSRGGDRSAPPEPAKRRFHDADGVPTPTSAAVIVIVVPFLVALAMFAGFYVYMTSIR